MSGFPSGPARRPCALSGPEPYFLQQLRRRPPFFNQLCDWGLSPSTQMAATHIDGQYLDPTIAAETMVHQRAVTLNNHRASAP
jgi:hypothetical protein